jgi:homoserine kinase type II
VAVLTALPLTEARRIAAEYGLELDAVEALAAGSVNSNFRWTPRGGQSGEASDRAGTGPWLFARIYEEQDHDGARAEIRLLDELAAAGVPVAPAVARTDGERVSEYGGKPVAVFPWIDGDILCQARVTPERARAVGTALAQIHLATPRVRRLGTGRFGLEHLTRRLDHIEARAPAELVEAASVIRRKLDEVMARRAVDLPSGVIHGDLFRDNVLWDGTAISALLDFESASQGPLAFDLMVTLLAWCYSSRFDADLIGAMLSGYHAERPLGAGEKAALAVEGAFACLRFATTRITDFSLRAPPGKPPVRDYRRMLARLEAFESGVLDTALTALP